MPSSRKVSLAVPRRLENQPPKVNRGERSVGKHPPKVNPGDRSLGNVSRGCKGEDKNNEDDRLSSVL